MKHDVLNTYDFLFSMECYKWIFEEYPGHSKWKNMKIAVNLQNKKRKKDKWK